MKTEIERLKGLIATQGRPGNWDYDPYMHGMLNGMILALSVFTGENPVFRDPPDRWLSNYKRSRKHKTVTVNPTFGAD